MASTHFQDSERTSPSGIGVSAATGFTLCGWVNWHATGYADIFWLHNSVGGWQSVGCSIRSDPPPTIAIISFAEYECQVQIEQNTWFFFCGTISGNTATLRVSTDGETINATDTQSITEGWDIDRIGIGGKASWELFAHAELNHIRVFTEVLTEDEILAELTSTAPAGSPWAAWELEDTKLNDYSGNSRHLTGSSGTLTIGTPSPPQPNNTAAIGSSF